MTPRSAPSPCIGPLLGFFGILACLVPSSVQARSTGTWRTTAETAHFHITAERGRGDAALEAAARLEAAYDSLSSFYGFAPKDRINVVLVDDEDYSNGFAYAANSWVVLYLPPSRFDLRGTTAWIPNVSAHELAHVFSLRKMGITSKFLGLEAFASFGFSRGRVDASVTWIPDDVPSWLAEGLAQYASMHLGFDTLDARRRMVLQEAWKANAMVPLKAMESFSGDGRDGELIYNQGFHLVDYLYRTRGRDAMNAMLADWDAHGYHASFERAFGASPEVLYAEWKETLDSAWGAPDPFGKMQGGGTEQRGRPPYTVRTAPIIDAKRDIQYFLASDPNDYGITHLYARHLANTGLTRRICRNVEASPRLSADGTLIFAAVRIDPATGARTGDLYRYRPDGPDRLVSVQRLTRGLRAFEGVEAGGSVYALVYAGGRTRLARLRSGLDSKPDRWVDAPAGTEFASVASGGEDALLLTVVRGSNADIYRLSLSTGILSPFEASPFNEIDPQWADGRLVFASDRSREYAIYSRDASGLRRLSPPGVSAFRPFLSGNVVWYSAYGAGGFDLATSKVSDAQEPGPASDKAPDTSNKAFSLPPLPALKNLKRDAAGKEWLGWYATAGMAFTPSVDVSDFYDSDANYRLNPCGVQTFAGGGSLWTDPAERSAVTLGVLAATCVDGTAGTGPYLPEASLSYISRNFTPDLLLVGQYQSQEVGRIDGGRVLNGGVHRFSVTGASQYYFGDYVTNASFAQVGGVVVDLARGKKTGGGGVAAGNTLGFAVFEPGVDALNRGLYVDGTLIASSGYLGGGADAGLFGNVKRTVFLGAQIDAFQGFAGDQSFDGGFSFSADTRLPLGASIGAAGYHGMFLEALFLRTGYSRRWNSEAGYAWTYGNNWTQGSAFRIIPPTDRFRALRRNGAVPVAQVLYQTPETVRLGLRLKAISPGSRLVYWDLDWETPPGGWSDGTLRVSINL